MYTYLGPRYGKGWRFMEILEYGKYNIITIIDMDRRYSFLKDK